MSRLTLFFPERYTALALAVIVSAGCASDSYRDGTDIADGLQQDRQAESADPDTDSDPIAATEARADELYRAGEFEQAFDLYLELGRNGDKFSQYRLAYMYEHGQGVSPDLAEAFAWSRLAAEFSDPKLVGYARYLNQRLAEAPPEIQQRAVERTESLTSTYAARVFIERRREALSRQLQTCTGSRVGACYGSTNVAGIDSARDGAAWARLTSSPGGGSGNALSRLRSQDGTQYWGDVRDELRLFNSWLRDLTTPSGTVDYGPLILIDSESASDPDSENDEHMND